MLQQIEIHFTIEKNGKLRKRRAIVDPRTSGVTAIRIPVDFTPTMAPPETDVQVKSDTVGDEIGDSDPGPGVCYEIGEETFCW